MNKLLVRLKKYFFEYKIKNDKDLYQALTKAEKNNVISRQSLDTIESVIQIANMRVQDIMTPRSKIISINIDAKMPDILKIMSDSAHSRFPVFNADKVQGILLAKDVFNVFVYHHSTDNISEYLRPHITVPETKSLESLLTEFQANKNHMALVVDEYGLISGLLTIEDILEQIVGEIEDEHDFEEDNVIDYGKGRYLVRANTTIAEFNKFFSTDFSDTNATTIAGIILSVFEKMPKQLDEIELSGFNFKVLKSDSRRLYLLEVKNNNTTKKNNHEK